MKFETIRYEGKSPYTDRTTMRNAWEPGEEKLVSEADAKQLMRYLEFKRVPAATTPEPADETSAEPKKGGKSGKKPASNEAALAQAQLAQQKAAATEKLKKDAIEDTLVEISVMEKDALEAYARQNYGVELDKRRSVDTLRNQVTDLVQGGVN